MAVKEIQRLRPAAMQSRPVRLDHIFGDPDAVVDLIQQRAPYVNLAEFHSMQDTLGGANTRAWFRSTFSDDLFLNNPRWIESARKSFSAQIVRPFKCILNLNGPMGPGGVHVDLPLYRGFSAQNAPVWLLMNMTYSGLFQDWMVPIASGLAWFYKGAGGAFSYWPDGVSKPPHREREPMWNTGVMSDNEFMWHAVGAIGTEEDRARLRGKIKHSDRLYYAGNGDWEIGDGMHVSAMLPGNQLRIALLWKAYVFRDNAHLASFENSDMDLTPDQVVDIYRDDLARRGIVVPSPSDLFKDTQWRKTLEQHYPQPFNEQMAGDYS